MENKMLVKLNHTSYEYDVHAIVKAFFPERDVKVLPFESREGASMDDDSNEGPDVEIRVEENGAWIRFGGREYEWQTKEKGWRGPFREDAGNLKNGFKAFLYRTLQEETGRSLPWGNLTGIRPTKIAYGMLDQGKSREEILDFLEKRHFVSRKKAALSIDIALRERQILSEVQCESRKGSAENGGYSLYVGIPFCPTTCLYCSFTSYPIVGFRKKVESYIDCLLKEMETVSGLMGGKRLDCVYIGGRTPTTLEPEQLDRVLSGLKRFFDFSQVKEFTVEAGRADSITEEKLEVLARHGVGRISINPQTMKQATLDLIGRKAAVKQVEEAYALARHMGFDNINMDLILGLPGELQEDVQKTVDRVVLLAPDSLTVHSLAIKRASRLNQWIQENGVSMLRNTDETMDIAARGAKRLGMEPYYLYRQKNISGNFENVGYAKPGKFGLYNILIMEEKQTIVACGAGSISKRVFPDGRIERCENVRDVASFMERIDEMIERKRKLFED